MAKYSDYTRVSELKDLPEGEHYVILEFDSYTTHDGYDERDGGGYSTHKKVEYIAFHSRELWEAEVKQRSQPVQQFAYGYSHRTPWVALVVRRPKVNVTINVDVGIGD